MTLVIDGKATAAGLRQQLAQEVISARSAAGRAPGLAVILVGEDPASAVYVRNKAKPLENPANEIGMPMPASSV